MKPIVDQDKCVACGACVAIAPDNFDFDSMGLSTVISEEVTEKTLDAEKACPVFAITIEDAENKTVDSSEECECNHECECEHECECWCECECDNECECNHHNADDQQNSIDTDDSEKEAI